NGSPTDEFRLERGVRQGDPLCLFLFIMAAERVNALVSEAVEKGIFKGALVDDDRIECFEEVSRLRVNYNKSRVYEIGVGSGEIEEMA
ncbi:hypothetical protein Tco_1490622, partial [Tanacetum coccineum]